LQTKIIAASLLVAIAGWLLPIPYKTVASQTETQINVDENDLVLQNTPYIQEVPHPARASTVKKTPAVSHLKSQKGGCEQYREAVQKYFGEVTDTALFIASKESGCRMDAVSSTADYCIFQINREPLTAKNIDLCVRRAWEKYAGGRVGNNNWSAWYSVCTPGNNPQPKYQNIKCL
jgi:hypothetical protein